MIEVRQGDCVAGMAELAEESIDAIVCDPPYGLEFMGKEWDSFRMDERSARWSSRSGEAGGFGQIEGGSMLPNYGRRRTTSRCRTCNKRDAFRNPHACGDNADWMTEYVDVTPVEMRAFQNWCHSWAVEAYRVLKPGGHLLAFGGTRTYHRLAVAVEDVGFEIRDSMIWIYGSGFPKSLDVGAAIDKRAGVNRADVYADVEPYQPDEDRTYARGLGVPLVERRPVTDEAKQWDGWGTALKPAHEPVVVARRPLVGTVAENVLAHGTGALNIHGGRVGSSGGASAVPGTRRLSDGATDFPGRAEMQSLDAGRWPANVVLSHLPECRGSGAKHTEKLCAPGCPVAELNEASGNLPGGYYAAGHERDALHGGGVRREVGSGARVEGGGAARFFYIAKAKRRERIAGVERSLHPTVKPVDLMRWLVRLVTPPGGLVLDPFTGSGTTGCAAALEGFSFLGFEQDPEYARQAHGRISEYVYAASRDDLLPLSTSSTNGGGTESRLDATPPIPEEGHDDEAEERTRGADRSAAREQRPDADQGCDRRSGEARARDEGQDSGGDAGGDDLHDHEEGRDLPGSGARDRRVGRAVGDDGDGAGRGSRQSDGDAGKRRRPRRGEAGSEADLGEEEPDAAAEGGSGGIGSTASDMSAGRPGDEAARSTSREDT